MKPYLLLTVIMACTTPAPSGTSTGTSSTGAETPTTGAECPLISEVDVAAVCAEHPHEHVACGSDGSGYLTCEGQFEKALAAPPCADKTICDYIACSDALKTAPCTEYPKACHDMFWCSTTNCADSSC